MEYVYLGDGLYARWDGYCVALLANSHDHPTDTVYLEPEVMQNLIDHWTKWIKPPEAAHE